MSEWHDASDHSSEAIAGVLVVMVDKSGYEVFGLGAWLEHSERWFLSGFPAAEADRYKVLRWQTLPIDELHNSLDEVRSRRGELPLEPVA